MRGSGCESLLRQRPQLQCKQQPLQRPLHLVRPMQRQRLQVLQAVMPVTSPSAFGTSLIRAALWLAPPWLQLEVFCLRQKELLLRCSGAARCCGAESRSRRKSRRTVALLQLQHLQLLRRG